MRAVRWLLRLIAYLFTLVAGLFLLGVGLMGRATGEELHFELVPGVEPESMPVALIGLGGAALLSLLMLPGGSPVGRGLLFVWNLLVFSLLLCALARPSYRFLNPEHIEQGAVLFVVSLAALAGAWSVMKTKRRR